MGRKKTYVGSVTQRLLSDKDFRTSSQYGINRYMQEQKSILQPTLGGISVSDTLVDAISASIPSKMRKAYKWAKKEGNYVFGVPDSTVATDAEGDIEVTLMNHLRGVEAAPVTLIDNIQNTKNMYHASWMKLVDMLGYSGLNNELKVLSLTKGHECYLYDGLLQLTTRTEEDLVLDTNIEQFGLAMTYGKCFDRPEDVNRTQQDYVIGLSDHLTITYAYKVPNAKPNIPMVNVFNTTGIRGYADVGSIVRYTDDLGEVQEVSPDSSGLFEFAAPSETTVSGTFISLNGLIESSPIIHNYPYENSTPFTEPLPTETVVYEDQIISLADINPEIVEGDDIPNEYEYIQAVYEVGSEYKWFSYAYLSGGIPALDGAANYSNDVGKYFPRFYIRQHAKDLISLPGSDQGRKNTEKIFKKLELKLKDITETVNKGIGDVTDEIKFSFLQMCVSINNDKDNNETSEYIFNYFNRLYAKGEVIKPDVSTKPVEGVEPKREEFVGEGDGRRGVSQRIADKVYTQQITYHSSWKKLNTGVAKNNAGEDLKVGEYCVKFIPNGADIESNPEGGFTLKRTPNIHTLIYQLSTTQHIQLQVVEINLRHMFYGQTVTSNGDDENLTIPLDYAIVYSLKTSEKEELMNKSLQLTVTTLKVVKQKWYQTGIFKFAMAAISIAMNVIVPGSGLTLMALLQAVAVTVITGLVINVAIGLLIKIAIGLGLSASIVAALAIVISIGAAAYGGGSFDLNKIMNAKDLLNVLNQSLDAFQKAVVIKINQIKEEMKSFGEYAKSEWSRLEKSQQLLDTGFIPPDLELLTRPINSNQVYFGESPEDFYTRTTTVDVSEMTTDIVGFFLQLTMSPPVPKRYEPERSMVISDVLLIN